MYIVNVTNGTQFFEDNTTTHGTLYWYTIVTVDSSGNFNASWPIRTAGWNATANDTIFPQSPTNLTATASGAIATLRWSNVTLDVRNNPDFYGMQYKLYYS